MEIISRRHRVTIEEYYLSFDFIDDPTGGFMFPCDKMGNVKMDELAEEAKSNLQKCQSGEYQVTKGRIRDFSHDYTEPAVGKCDCGHEVALSSFTNTCSKCGSDYNMSGQLLAARSQWGEETGETVDEILNIGHSIS